MCPCLLFFLLTVQPFRFKPAIVKECIHETVKERLSGVQYQQENVKDLSNSLAVSIKDRVKC